MHGCNSDFLNLIPLYFQNIRNAGRSIRQLWQALYPWPPNVGFHYGNGMNRGRSPALVTEPTGTAADYLK